MDKKIKIILLLVALALIASAVCSCRTSKCIPNKNYQDSTSMSQSERDLLTQGQNDLKEMEHLTKIIWIRK